MPEAIPGARPPKIHFAALVGVEVDADLLPWWAPHYAAMGLDSYTVFLHESIFESKNRRAEDLLHALGYKVRRVPENALRESPDMPGCPDGVRKILMENFAASLHPKDFLITADGDEIQEWRELPREAVARGVSIMMGRLIDRFDDTLHNAIPGKSLEESFPGEHENLTTYFKKIPLTLKKICMAPANYPLEYSGSHAVKLGEFPNQPLYISSGPIRVLHYRWRETAYLRVKDRHYWLPEELEAMKKFFSIEG